jgi:L-fucose isomerase-like protein
MEGNQMSTKTTLGVIIGNRRFFPDRLAKEGRAEILKLLREQGIRAICLSPKQSKYGCVETWEEAKRCGELFAANRAQIDGILVSLPNFGDERAVAESIRLSGLRRPVLVHAYPDEIGKMGLHERRDSFCGKLSVCSNLRQYRIPFSLTRLHTVSPASDSFREDLASFEQVCRVVEGLRRARLGAIGARPGPFKTVRYSEKALEAAGISVDTIDLSEIIGRCHQLREGEPAVSRKLTALTRYCPTEGIPREALRKMAKFALVLEQWMNENDLVAGAIQCWTALEEFFGIVPCGVMSLLTDSFRPCACEVDVMGALAMFALQLASGRASALVDWNNNYADDPDKVVVFHCGNLPRSLVPDTKMAYSQILAANLGKERTYGACSGRISAGPFTFARITTEEGQESISAYVGEGEFTPDPLATFGGYGVARIPRLQALMQEICQRGFEHHVAVNAALVGRALREAIEKYLGWPVFYHA